MPNFINYSPWQDAASYGRGLGDVLGQILLQEPQRKLEMTQQAQRFPLEQQLLQAQIKNTNYRPDYSQEALAQKAQQEADRVNYQQGMLGVQQGNLDIRQMLADLADKVKNQQIGINQQNADSNTEKAGKTRQPIPPSPTEVEGVNNLIGKLLPNMGQTSYGGTLNTNIPENVMVSAQQLLSNPANRGGNPLDLLQQFIQPNVQTNEPSLISRLMGNGQPTVSTNGAQFAIPNGMQPRLGSGPGVALTPSALPLNLQSQGGQAPPPTATNSQTGQRLQLINGQWTPIQ